MHIVEILDALLVRFFLSFVVEQPRRQILSSSAILHDGVIDRRFPPSSFLHLSIPNKKNELSTAAG